MGLSLFIIEAALLVVALSLCVGKWIAACESNYCTACGGMGLVFDEPEKGIYDDMGEVCSDCDGAGVLPE